MENIDNLIQEINDEIQKYRFNLYNEKELQEQLHSVVLAKLGFSREYKLDKKSIIDFYNKENKIGIEIKVKGQVTSIFRQCKRYAKKDEIKYIVLITSIAMNLPKEIEGKRAFILRISNSWL